jgi:hypothetical protein
MQNDQAGIFGRRANQQVGDLSAMPAPGGKHALNLAGALTLVGVAFAIAAGVLGFAAAPRSYRSRE